jgi:hypothetical protein
MTRYRPLRAKSLRTHRRSLVDTNYLRWLRSLACAIPGCADRHIEAAHIGVRGFGVRCSDREAIPLCAGHHRNRRDAHHVLGKRFWEHHGLERQVLIECYNAMYEIRAIQK